MTTPTRKGKIAIIKFGGMASGGTEKYLQIIASRIPKNKFDVDFFWTDGAPYIGSDHKHGQTDQDRLNFMKGTGVNLIKVDVAAKDVTNPTHPWVDHNLWDLFNEEDYDVVMSARAGHPEFPFTEIKNTPIVDSIHLTGMVDNQANIVKVIHINNQNAQAWVKAGGSPSKIEVIYPPIIPPSSPLLPNKTDPLWDSSNLRDELGINPDDFVFGLHQRDNEQIYSEWPIGAFAEVQKKHPEVHFVLLGGANKHITQGASLKNFHHLPHTGDINRVWQFLRSLDVYTHGRRDGEVNSQAIAEAMRCGLPIVSHLGMTNGHVETIGDAGFVHDNFDNYVKDCTMYVEDNKRLKVIGQRAKDRFKKMYDVDVNVGKIVQIFDDILADAAKDELSDDDFWDTV